MGCNCRHCYQTKQHTVRIFTRRTSDPAASSCRSSSDWDQHRARPVFGHLSAKDQGDSGLIGLGCVLSTSGSQHDYMRSFGGDIIGPVHVAGVGIPFAVDIGNRGFGRPVYPSLCALATLIDMFVSY